jgi:primosomal protein N' (replication factor Y)
MGFGTQRVEEELQKLLPKARILRMDTDTTSTKFAYDTMLGEFRNHEADLLLGTQMVTKGHDFPDVTLVGVLLADASLYLDDYRASERTFSMLTQVIGRAGRGEKPGLAVIQTNNPDSEVIRLACAQDYEGFYEREIRLRKLLTFPPFCDIALLTMVSGAEAELLRASNYLTTAVKHLSQTKYNDVALQTFGPFEAPVYRVDNKYRMRMVVKCILNKRSREMFAKLLLKFSHPSSGKVTVGIDFNPGNL